MARLSKTTCLLCALLLLWLPFTSAQFNPDVIFDIDEESDKNSFVGNIPEEMNLDLNSRLRYTFVDQGSSYEELFVLNNTTGVLRTAVVIDRDDFCTNEITCSIQLVVQVQPRENFQIIKVQVEVNDLNDNSPVFPRDEINLLITEASPVDSRFTIPAAEDPDSPRYGIARYTIQQPEDFFEVQQGAVPEDLQLVLLKPLDRETTNLTTVVVSANDGGSPPRTGSIVINIEIQDVNDNNPRFSRQYYDVDVYENATRNTEVARVHATDPDTGPNGQVIYGFSSQTEAVSGSLFVIYEDTGAVVLVGGLDYETSREHILTVTARDSHPDSVPARAKLNVHVLDVNDNPPTFRMNTAPAADGHWKVSEDAQIDDFFAHITVRDADSGRNGQFTCSISDDHFTLQRLYEYEFKIVIGAKFDYEQKNTYDVTLTCEDEGEEPLIGALSFIVDVIDENDNSPIFTQSTYFGNVTENNVPGAVVLVVNATDLDSGENARVTYSIVPEDDTFEVDSYSGVVTAKSSLDREDCDGYNFTVVATDHGHTSMSSTALVVVTVLNDDTEIPEFVFDEFNFSVAENLEAGVHVGDLEVRDYDVAQDTNYQFTLSFQSAFTVDPRTGEIRTAMEFDRETQGYYEFNVTISNTANENQFSKALVNVRILDVNDNPPIIDFPSFDNRTIRYVYNDRNTQPQTLTSILAHDIDGTSGSSLTYHLINSTCTVHIDEQTGVVKINGSSLAPEQVTIEVWFEVRDNGEPPLSVQGSFHVAVVRIEASTSNSYLIIMICIIIASVIVVVILIIFIIRTFRRTRKVRKLKWMAAMVDPRNRPFQKTPEPTPNELWIEPDYRQEKNSTPTCDIATIDRVDDAFPSVSQIPSVRNSVASTNSSLISRGGQPIPPPSSVASSSGSLNQVGAYSNQGYDSATSDNSERSCREGRRQHKIIYQPRHTITKPAVYNPNPDQHEAIPIEQDEFSGQDSGRGSSVADLKMDTPILEDDDQWEPEYVVDECEEEYPDNMYPILDLSEVRAAEMNPEIHRSCLRNSICGAEMDAPSWVPSRPISQQLNVRFSLPDVQNGSMRSLDMSTMSSISTLSSYGGALI